MSISKTDLNTSAYSLVPWVQLKFDLVYLRNALIKKGSKTHRLFRRYSVQYTFKTTFGNLSGEPYVKLYRDLKD